MPQASGGSETHTPQSFSRKKSREGALHSAQHVNGGEDKGLVVSVRHGVLQHRQSEGQVRCGARLAPAMAAAQTFRFDPLACASAALDAKGAQGLPIGADAIPASTISWRSGGEPDMVRLNSASAPQRRKIQPGQRWISHRFSMGLKRRAIPVKADPGTIMKGKLEHMRIILWLRP